MTSYQRRKEEIREQAIEWQHNFCDNNYDMLELANTQNNFAKLGKRYGLLREFHENGIC